MYAWHTICDGRKSSTPWPATTLTGNHTAQEFQQFIKAYKRLLPMTTFVRQIPSEALTRTATSGMALTCEVRTAQKRCSSGAAGHRAAGSRTQGRSSTLQAGHDCTGGRSRWFLSSSFLYLCSPSQLHDPRSLSPATAVYWQAPIMEHLVLCPRQAAIKIDGISHCLASDRCQASAVVGVPWMLLNFC